MPGPQIAKYRNTSCKENLHLDCHALFSAFSQLQIFPPCSRKSLNQRKQKGEAQKSFQLISLQPPSQENLFFFLLQIKWITNYFPEEDYINYILPSHFLCLPESLPVSSVKSQKVFYSHLLSCSSSVKYLRQNCSSSWSCPGSAPLLC